MSTCFPRTTRLWVSLPSECFLLSYSRQLLSLSLFKQTPYILYIVFLFFFPCNPMPRSCCSFLFGINSSFSFLWICLNERFVKSFGWYNYLKIELSHNAYWKYFTKISKWNAYHRNETREMKWNIKWDIARQAQPTESMEVHLTF